jgi:hypothetical protein
MLKKYHKFIIIIILLIILIILFFILFKSLVKEDKNDSLVRIATCPTFYQFLNQLNNNHNYSVILTSSTSASLAMLEKKYVDYAVGGRKLMPEERNFNFVVVGEGFSFISDKSFFLYDYDLGLYPIYSDLDLDLLKTNFGDLNYQIVDNVYDYLKTNIVMTSWENTDYS